MSTVWEYRENKPLECSNSDTTECIANPADLKNIHSANMFHKVYDIPSFGATDCEHFIYEGAHYLAISEEGDLGKGINSSYESKVYNIGHGIT